MLGYNIPKKRGNTKARKEKTLEIKPPTADDDEKYRLGWEAYMLVEGRAVATVINGWKGTSYLAISVYLDTRDGDGPKNRNILMELAIKIEELGMRFIIGGDFNYEQATIISWLRTLGLISDSVAANSNSCKTSQSGSNIDFFIIFFQCLKKL
mgnify:CR=1 FL=1